LYLVRVGDVRLLEGGRPAELCCQRVAARGIHIRDHDLGAFFYEELDRGAAETAGAAGDDRDFFQTVPAPFVRACDQISIWDPRWFAGQHVLRMASAYHFTLQAFKANAILDDGPRELHAARGHFAAMEQPALFVEDLRSFFRTVR